MLSEVTNMKRKLVLVWFRFPERYRGQWGIACWGIWYRGESRFGEVEGDCCQ
jgi:hypothetical protein